MNWKTILKHVPRIVLGLIFLLGALDELYLTITGTHLVHPPTSPAGLEFEKNLQASGFIWPFMKIIEFIGAICLLSNKAPAFGIAILAPVMAVIVLFHLSLNPAGLPLAAILVMCGLWVVFENARRFAPLFESGSAS